MIARARRFFSLALRFKGMIDRERKTKSGLGLTERWTAWRRGFVSESLMIYEMNKRPGAYLSDYARHVRTPDINERFKSVLDNKFIFSRMFGAEVFRTPQVYFWLDRGRTFAFRGESVVKAATADVIALCRDRSRLIVKSVDGGGGAVVPLRRGADPSAPHLAVHARDGGHCGRERRGAVRVRGCLQGRGRSRLGRCADRGDSRSGRDEPHRRHRRVRLAGAPR